MASLVRLRSLGQCAFDVGPVRIDPDAKMRFAMLLFLAIERGKQISRGALAELLWPGVAPRHARHSLRHLTYVLRALGIPIGDGSGALELPSDCVELDYESAIATERVPDAGYPEFLPGYDPPFSSAFSEWVDLQRSHVHGSFRLRLLKDLTARRLSGRWSDVEQAARNCLRFDPLNEEATLALAEATALNGSKASAVAILDQFIAELHTGPRDIRIPASVLRRRIAEKLASPYSASAEACFVGRDDTLALLTTHVRRLRQSQGSSFLMWGPAGIGKSRLALEATRVATLEGVRATRTVCQTSDTRRPLSVFADLVPCLLDLPGSLGCAPSARQYLTRLTQSDATTVERGDGITPTPTDAAFTHARVGQAILDLIDAVSEEAPLLVVVENVHWMDSLSAEILRELVERGERRALQLILTSRHLPPSDSPLHGYIHGLTVCELAPITDADARQLFTSVTTGCDRVLDERSLDRAIALAEGNPFFVRELAAHWATTGLAEQLPSSLTAAIHERLDQLDGAALQVFQAAALLGKHSTFARVEEVLAYPQFQLLGCLQALDTQGLLSTMGSQVRVKHDLLAETAVARLSPAARRFLHRRIGITLEHEIDLAQSGTLWDCARHLQDAGEKAKALVVLRRCACQSLELGSPTYAVEILDHAHAYCETDDDRVQLGRELVLALRAAGLWARIVALDHELAPYGAASPAPTGPHDDVELAVLEALWETERRIPAILDRALVCLRASSASPGHRVRAGIWALILAHNIPDADVARDVYRTLGSITRGAQTPNVDRLTADLIYHTAFGDLRRGADAGARLVAATRRAGDQSSLSRVMRLASVPLLYLGRFAEVRDLLCEGLEMLERRRLRWGMFITTASVVRSYFEEGDLRSASLWYQRLIRLADSPDDLARMGPAHLLGAKIALIEHRYEAPEVVDFPPLSRWDAIASARAQSIATGVWALSALRRGLIADPSELIMRLRSVFERAKCAGNQDFPAFALFEMIRATGDERLAATTLRRYVDQERRERSPLPPFLAVAYASLANASFANASLASTSLANTSLAPGSLAFGSPATG
jgi:DNA-binding SARP family transcriptional activator